MNKTKNNSIITGVIIAIIAFWFIVIAGFLGQYSSILFGSGSLDFQAQMWETLARIGLYAFISISLSLAVRAYQEK